VEQTEDGLVLRNEGVRDDSSRVIPLDSGGAMLFEVPRKDSGFRRSYFKDFLDYEEADGSLRRLLGEAGALGVYNGLEGEKHPGFLYDYALSLREDLLADPDDQQKLSWIEARNNYFMSLEEFLYGPWEMNLVSGYEELIASETLGEGGGEELVRLRNSLIRAFVNLREKYNQVFELRAKLDAALNGAFCILGPGSAGDDGAAKDSRTTAAFPRNVFRFFENVRAGTRTPRFTDTEASALLANSLLTGRAITPGRDLYLFLGSLACALLTALILWSKNAAPSLSVGCLITLLSGAGFSLGFIFSGVWLNPLVPAAASFSAAMVSFIWAVVMKRRFNRLFRLCYGPAVSRQNLRRVIRAGQPKPSDAVTVHCAVVAVRNPGLMVQEDRADPRSGAKLSLSFREAIAGSFRQAGGTVLGSEGDMILACFGSPLERVAQRGTNPSSPSGGQVHAKDTPAAKAVEFVQEYIRRNSGDHWYYGIDAGECTFTWSPQSGYSVFGRPAIRARILLGLVSHYHAQVLVTASINEALPDLPAKKLDILKEQDGSGGESFYELLLKQ
jgi:class 3 adenylate cyclase